MDVQELIDRAEITDAITRYTIGIDTREFDRLDTVFAPGAQLDYSESGGIAADFPTAKAWLAQNLPAFSTKYLHTIGQVSFSFASSRDEARVAAYFHNPMLIDDGQGGERLVEVGGIYHHSFARTPDGWRSVRLHEQVMWTRGF